MDRSLLREMTKDLVRLGKPILALIDSSQIANHANLHGDRRTLGLRILRTSCWMWGRPHRTADDESALWRENVAIF
jgi:hypothetical protein